MTPAFGEVSILLLLLQHSNNQLYLALFISKKISYEICVSLDQFLNKILDRHITQQVLFVSLDVRPRYDTVSRGIIFSIVLRIVDSVR